MFLRRKKSNLNDAVVPQAAYHSNAQPAASTPLYERFATTTRGAASAPTSPGRSSAGISRPMALGMKPGMVGGMGVSSTRASLEARTGVSPPKPTSINPYPDNRKLSQGNLRGKEKTYEPPVPSYPSTRQTKSRVTDEWSSGEEVSSDTERYGGQRRPNNQPQPHPTPLSPPTSPGAQRRPAKVKSREAKSGAARLPTPPSPRSKPLPPPVPDLPEPPLPRLTIPSSASLVPSTESGSRYGAPTPTATSSPSNLSAAPSRTPLSSSPSSPSKSTPATSPASPSVDEAGFVARTSNGPALGNSLTSRAPPIRRKYSPLAAFGLSTDEPKPPAPSIIVSSSSTDIVSGSDAKVKSSAVLNVASIEHTTSPQLSPYVSAESSTSALAGSASAGGSSPPKVDLSERHTSFQPLKTASVELRVAFNSEEEKFHSPLFASIVPATSGDTRLGTASNVSENDIPPAIDNISASENKAKKERGGRDRKNVISSSTRHEMNGLNGAGLGRSARTLPAPPFPLPSTSPILPSPLQTRPSPSSPSHERKEQLPENNHRPRERSHSASKMRQRTNSNSSTSSAGKRRELATPHPLPDLPVELAQPPQRDILYATGPSRQASRESIADKAKQIPTPPTSVDGHSIRSGKSSRTKGAQLDGSASRDGRIGRARVDVDQDVTPIPTVAMSDAGTRATKVSNAKRRTDAEGLVDQQLRTGPLTAPASVKEHSFEQPTSSDQLTADPIASPPQHNSDATASKGVYSHPPGSPPHSHASQTQPIAMPFAPGSRRARSGSSSRKTIEVGSPSGHTSRKLYKQPPAMHMVPAQAVESPIDLATGAEMPSGADPFAKDDVLRTPTAPFAQTHTGPAPPSPSSPDDYFAARSKRRGERLEKRPKDVVEAVVQGQEPNGRAAADDGQQTPRAFDRPETNEVPEEEGEPEPEREPTFYPLERHLTTQPLLAGLLPYLTFRDWCIITEVNDAMRRTVEHRKELREAVLEYYLGTVGYSRWKSPKKEPIMLTFRDLNSYMRGVSIPSHQYANTARAWLESRVIVEGDPDRSIAVQKTLLASSCRAYTRVVLRLRAQAEADTEDGVYEFSPSQSSVSVNSPHSRYPISRSRPASRPASPTSSVGHSVFSHSNNGHGRYPHSEHGRAGSGNGNPVSRFRSPLFRVGHAPFLRVFVPNEEGEWLSDQSVTDCEKELKRAGVLPLLRVGDVVWDAAVGDEGNVGRMVWDGNYLIDLDYTYSRIGELPQYIHTLAFPPSYFHRVIRTNGNPMCYIDIAPWGDEIAANLQLLQDRIKTETPQGGHHTVVRWIHRSKFRIRPNPFTKALIPIPGTLLSIDPGWYGYVIVETEGTNEGLADLQDRCRGIGFPPRAGAPQNKPPSKVFRLLRERSRPGEIWIRAVREKERIL